MVCRSQHTCSLLLEAEDRAHCTLPGAGRGLAGREHEHRRSEWRGDGSLAPRFCHGNTVSKKSVFLFPNPELPKAPRALCT